MRTRPASVEETGPAFARVKGDDTMADDRGVFEGKEVAAASAGILAKCDQRGMVMPFILVSVSRNGSVQVVRVRRDGGEVISEALAWHYEDAQSFLPISCMVLDQNDEVFLDTINVGDATFH